MSLPPHDKDNPIPVSLKRTIEAVKLVCASLSDEGLTEIARRELVTKLSFEAGSTRNHPAGDVELVFWLGQLRAIPTDVPLTIDNLGGVHPVIAHALVSKDVDDFFEANGSRYWTNEGFYRKRATSAAPIPLDPAQSDGASDNAPATSSTPAVSGPPQIVTVEGVGEIPAYQADALPRGTDGIVIVEKRLFLLSTQFDATQFPVGCLAQLVASPKGLLVSTQAAIDEEERNWADIESERMEQLMQLAGNSARPATNRAQRAPPQVLSAPPMQQYPSVQQPVFPAAQLASAEAADDEDRRYRLERLNAARAAPAYSADPKVIGRLSQEASWDKARTLPRNDPTRLETAAGIIRLKLQRQGAIKMDVIEVMKIMCGAYVDVRDVVQPQGAELFDSYTDENGIEFTGIQARAQRKASKVKPSVTDFPEYVRALKEIQAVENEVFGTWAGANWSHYLKFLNDMHAGVHSGMKGSKLPIAFDERFRTLRSEPNGTVTSLLEANAGHSVYVNVILNVATIANQQSTQPALEERTFCKHPSPLPNASGSTKKKSTLSKIDWICMRFNRGQPHPSETCRLDHVCWDCATEGHRSGDRVCSNLEAGIGARLARMAAKSSARPAARK